MVLRKHELESKLGEESHLIKTGVLRDDNPLEDSEEFARFLLACRQGDLRKCQEYINLGVNINGKDQFDYTGLIIVRLRLPAQAYLQLTMQRQVYVDIMKSFVYF